MPKTLIFAYTHQITIPESATNEVAILPNIQRREDLTGRVTAAALAQEWLQLLTQSKISFGVYVKSQMCSAPRGIWQVDDVRAAVFQLPVPSIDSAEEF